MDILTLAINSFGLVVPTELHNEEPFDAMDLREDSLIRIDHVSEEDCKITFSDSNGDQTVVSYAMLEEYADKLKGSWVSLVPTSQKLTGTWVDRKAVDLLDALSDFATIQGIVNESKPIRTVKVRQFHRLLDESMKTLTEIPASRKAVEKWAYEFLRNWGVSKERLDEIVIKRYVGEKHHLNGWNTYAIELAGPGVIGFCDGPVED